MKIKTSVTLSEELIQDMDRMLKEPGMPKNRSAFLEEALRQYLASIARQARDRLDLEILNREAPRLNEEAQDVLAYQVDI